MKKISIIVSLVFLFIFSFPNDNQWIPPWRRTRTPIVRTATRTATRFLTRTQTRTRTPTRTFTQTKTPTVTFTSTIIPSATETPTPTYTGVATDTYTPIPQNTFTATATQQTQTYQPYGVPGNWVMIFSDEFNGTALDTSKWYTCYPWQGTICDNNNTLNMWYTPNNVSVQDGFVRLTARKENYNGRPYTSGMLSSQKPDMSVLNGDFQYGFMEIRMKTSMGNGLWPAFWTVGINDWPPELDIFEINGVYAYNMIHMAYGWGSNGNVTWDYADYRTTQNFYNSYHIYSANWEAGRIDWYIDGIKARTTYSSSNVTTMNMFILLTLQLGGGGSSIPTPLDSELPAYMDIDYVRVWQK